jgi:alpha-L-fucosidase 2
MPWRWHNASFENLRSEGGHRVSARRENNATTWFRIVAGRDGWIRIHDNFGGRVPRWNRSGVKKVDGNFEMECKTGNTLEAMLPPPIAIPAAPPNLAAPVEIKRH